MDRHIKRDFFELSIFDSIKSKHKLHTHPNLCICWIKQGEMLFLNERDTITLKPYDIIIFNPQKPHRLLSYKDVKEYFVLHVKSDINLKQKLVKSKEDYIKLLNLEKSEDKLVEFLKKYQDIDILHEPSPLEEIKRYIQNNLNKEITLEELAKKANLNKSYLSRTFKKEYGLSPINYSINQKINYSKILLQNGMEISEVALELGFYDQAHFYKAFKSIFYITPKEYQNLTK